MFNGSSLLQSFMNFYGTINDPQHYSIYKVMINYISTSPTLKNIYVSTISSQQKSIFILVKLIRNSDKYSVQLIGIIDY